MNFHIGSDNDKLSEPIFCGFLKPYITIYMIFIK